MENLGKILLTLGGVLVIAGLVIWGLGKAGFKGMPGDISYKSENVQFHFPIITCIVLSVLASAAMWIWKWFSK